MEDDYSIGGTFSDLGGIVALTLVAVCNDLKRGFRLMVDTGTTFTALAPHVIEQIHPRPTPYSTRHTGTGRPASLPAPLFQLDSILLLGDQPVEAFDHLVVVQNWATHLSGIDGLIGSRLPSSQRFSRITLDSTDRNKPQILLKARR